MSSSQTHNEAAQDDCSERGLSFKIRAKLRGNNFRSSHSDILPVNERNWKRQSKVRKQWDRRNE